MGAGADACHDLGEGRPGGEVMPPKTRVLSCARCGKRVREGTYIYSRFTKNRYCIDMDACARRAANKAKRK